MFVYYVSLCVHALDRILAGVKREIFHRGGLQVCVYVQICVCMYVCMYTMSVCVCIRPGPDFGGSKEGDIPWGRLAGVCMLSTHVHTN